MDDDGREELGAGEESRLICIERGRNASERIMVPWRQLYDKLFESELIIRSAAAIVEKGLSTIAVELDRIRIEKLYKAVLNDNGEPLYYSFNTYLRGRSRELGFKRTKATTLLQGVRALKGSSLGYTAEEISQMPTEVLRLLPGIVETDRKTGEIISFRAGVTLPELITGETDVDRLRTYIDETAALDEAGAYVYDPLDRVKRLTSDLMKRDDYNFWTGRDGDYLVFTGCDVRTFDGEVVTYGPEDIWPDEVYTEYQKRLRATRVL